VVTLVVQGDLWPIVDCIFICAPLFDWELRLSCQKLIGCVQMLNEVGNWRMGMEGEDQTPKSARNMLR